MGLEGSLHFLDVDIVDWAESGAETVEIVVGVELLVKIPVLGTTSVGVDSVLLGVDAVLLFLLFVIVTVNICNEI